MNTIKKNWQKILMVSSYLATLLLTVLFVLWINNIISSLVDNGKSYEKSTNEITETTAKNIVKPKLFNSNDDYNFKSILSQEEMEAVFGEKKPVIKYITGSNSEPIKKINRPKEKGVIGSAPRFRRPTEAELNDSELYEEFSNARNLNALKEKVKAMNELDGRLSLLKEKYAEFNLDSGSIELSLNDIENAIERDTNLINKLSDEY